MTNTSSKAKAPGRESEGLQKNTSKPRHPNLSLSPRQARVLHALELRANQLMPWLRREEVDRVARASNGPDVVMKLRSKLGGDAIDTQIVDVTDSDGRPSRPGRYRLTGIGLARLAQMGETR